MKSLIDHVAGSVFAIHCVQVLLFWSYCLCYLLLIYIYTMASDLLSIFGIYASRSISILSVLLLIVGWLILIARNISDETFSLITCILFYLIYIDKNIINFFYCCGIHPEHLYIFFGGISYFLLDKKYWIPRIF